VKKIFELYENDIAQGFPNLKTLNVDQGQFSIATAAMFKTVTNYKFGCAMFTINSDSFNQE
jgi:hypothetical protein